MKKILSIVSLLSIISLPLFANAQAEKKVESVTNINCSVNDSVDGLYDKLEGQYNILLDKRLEKLGAEMNQGNVLGLIIEIRDIEHEITTCNHMLVTSKSNN